MVVFAFSDYNFAENQNNLRSPDFQDFCFLDVCNADNSGESCESSKTGDSGETCESVDSGETGESD